MNPAEASGRDRVAKPSPGDGRAWLGLVLESQPFPTLVVDRETSRVVLANEAARRVPLETPDDAGDHTAFLASGPDEERLLADGLHRHLARLAAGPDGIDIAWEARRQRYYFRVYSRALTPADGLAPLAVLTFLDVTQQRAAEAELRRALEVRDEFFSIATHELKDPLFSLQLSNQLLRHTATRLGEVPPHILHHLEVGHRQTERLSQLVDNLLDVSRILNRRLQLDVEAFDLGELTTEVLERFRERAQDAGTAISAEAPGPVIGYFDRLKMEQVVTNLLSNALKYGAGRPVAIRVHARGEQAVLQVEDWGPGIPPEHQVRIFERFERASDGHRKESLGLGLYIVRSLVEAHGGTIGVASEPGRGATFEVVLPRDRIPGAGGPPPAADIPGPTQG